VGHDAPAPARPAVRFDVLGPLDVRADGTTLAINAPKQRALLLRLLVDVGRTVPTDRLIEDLWDGSAPPGALSSLRAYVSNLRRVLAADDPDAPAVLVTHGSGYALQVPTDAVDSHRFEGEVADARAALGSGDAAGALVLLDRALARWRGPALADVADAPFARPTITRLDELHRLAQEERFEALLAAGRHHDAIADLERYVPTEPLRERPRRQLALALHRAGRSPDALQVHRDFRDTLVAELGLDPSVEFDRLADAILRQDPALKPPATTPSLAPSPPAGASTSSTTTTPPPADHDPSLVGRDGERHLVAGAVRRLGSGQGGVLLFGGEPGIGKSTLLEEVARQGATVGAVHWGRCPETDGAPAFWPWTRLLRSLVAQETDAALVDLVEGVEPLVHLVPDLGRRTRTAAPAMGDDLHAARFELFDAATTFLRRRAEAGPLVVLLDDLHWADHPSLELLGFLASQLDDLPLLVAATYRDAPAERTEALDRTLATVVRHAGADDVHLGGLDADGTAEVVTAALGRTPDPALIEVLHARTDGNPFFVTQLARLLDEAGGSRTRIPSGVRHVLVRRLQLLPTDTQQLLELAAVVGRSFDATVVAAAADRELVDVLEAADAAHAHGLIEPDGSSARRFRFVHALVRETLHDGLSPATTARLHAAVATALTALGGCTAQELAEHHWLAAGLVPTDRTVRTAIAAADEAMETLAYEQAETHLRRALSLLDAARDTELDTELAVRTRLVSLLTSAVGWSAPDIADIAGRVVDLTEQHGLRPELLPLWHLAWTCRTTRGDIAGGVAMARELKALAARHDDDLHDAMATSMLGYCGLHLGGDGAEHLALIRDARERLDRQPEEHLAATPEHLGVTVRLAATVAAALVEDRDAALAEARATLAYAERVGRPFPSVAAHLFAAWAGAVVDDPAFTLEQTRRGLALCERYGFRQATHLLTPLDGWAAARAGADPAVEAARIAEALQTLDATGHLHARPSWAVLLAEVHLLAGDPDAARAAVAAGRAIVEVTGERVHDRFLDAADAPIAAQAGSGWLETNRPSGS
jgi:DNA-binding SARP family transcriptional activator